MDSVQQSVQCKRVWKRADERAESMTKANLHPEKVMPSVWREIAKELFILSCYALAKRLTPTSTVNN